MNRYAAERVILKLLSTGLGRAVVGVAAVAIVSVVLAIWPRHWQLLRQDGSLLCTVSTGWPSSDVEAVCGPALKAGDQPKVARSSTEFCSAPCELRGRHVVFYDCDRRIARVELVTADWQGCAFR